MPVFIAKQVSSTSGTKQVSKASAKLIGSARTYQVSICDKNNLFEEIWNATLTENWHRTVLGPEAAKLFQVADFGFINVMLYDKSKNQMNGFRSQIRINANAKNPFMVFLSWDEIKQFFGLRAVQGGLILTADTNKLGYCVPV